MLLSALPNEGESVSQANAAGKAVTRHVVDIGRIYWTLVWFADTDTKVLWTAARERRSLFMWTSPTPSARANALSS